MVFVKRKYILIVLALFALFRVNYQCLNIELPLHLTKIRDVCSRGVEKKERPNSILNKAKHRAVKKVKEIIPSPHAELLLGMVLGFNDLKSIPRFNDVLIRSGTIHVVVVSGYNINLVFNFLSKLFGTKYKSRNLLFLQIIAIIYALITGFEPPIVRALLMCSVFVWGSFYGRKIDVLYVFTVTAMIMIIYNPKYAFDISFQLSGGATLGLIVYSSWLEKMFNFMPLPSIIKSDFLTTISAQIYVWPLIARYFERVSLASYISNPLTLWIVPLITLSGVFIVIFALFCNYVSKLIWVVIYPLSYLFVNINELVSKLPFAERAVMMSSKSMIIYYMSAIFIPILVKSIKFNKNGYLYLYK